MGAPTSCIVSEIYLQYLENTKIFDILVKHHIIRCFQYIEDIRLNFMFEWPWTFRVTLGGQVEG